MKKCKCGSTRFKLIEKLEIERRYIDVIDTRKAKNNEVELNFDHNEIIKLTVILKCTRCEKIYEHKDKPKYIENPSLIVGEKYIYRLPEMGVQ